MSGQADGKALYLFTVELHFILDAGSQQPVPVSHPPCVYLPKKPISCDQRFSFSEQSAPETKKLNSEPPQKKDVLFASSYHICEDDLKAVSQIGAVLTGEKNTTKITLT